MNIMLSIKALAQWFKGITLASWILGLLLSSSTPDSDITRTRKDEGDIDMIERLTLRHVFPRRTDNLIVEEIPLVRRYPADLMNLDVMKTLGEGLDNSYKYKKCVQ